MSSAATVVVTASLSVCYAHLLALSEIALVGCLARHYELLVLVGSVALSDLLKTAISIGLGSIFLVLHHELVHENMVVGRLVLSACLWHRGGIPLVVRWLVARAIHHF